MPAAICRSVAAAGAPAGITEGWWSASREHRPRLCTVQAGSPAFLKFYGTEQEWILLSAPPSPMGPLLSRGPVGDRDAMGERV